MFELYNYQKKYLREAKPNWIYDCDTGVGKTVMALAHYRVHFGNKQLCIVAPASKIKEGGWQRTLKVMCPYREYKIISYNVINRYIDKLQDYFIIFDECHRIKDSTGVWGKSAYNICKKSAGFILLSATPLPNNWIDSINYFKIFGLTKNKTQFLKRFAITSMQWGYQEIIGWRNLKSLNDYWKSISSRLNKEQCLDLPPLVFKEIHFKPGKVYREILHNRYLRGVLYDNAMKYRHGLRQHCAIEPKITYLKDFLESTNQNIVIFYNYLSELEEIKKAIKNKTVYECNGQIKNFPTDNFGDIKNTVTLANYKSGSEGVEFTYADIIIYFSPTESYTEYYQSYGRCHRIGQEKKVTCYKFITKNTIEVAIYDALTNKQDFNFELWEQKKREYYSKRP